MKRTIDDDDDGDDDDNNHTGSNKYKLIALIKVASDSKILVPLANLLTKEKGITSQVQTCCMNLPSMSKSFFFRLTRNPVGAGIFGPSYHRTFIPQPSPLPQDSPPLRYVVLLVQDIGVKFLGRRMVDWNQG
jgi:hypothetical protein